MTSRKDRIGKSELRSLITYDRGRLEDRLKLFLAELDIENDSLLRNGTLVDRLDRIISSGLDDSLTREYEIDHDNIEWKEEESKPLSELVLKKDKKDTEQ